MNSDKVLNQKFNNSVSTLNFWFNKYNVFLNLDKSTSIRFHNQQKVVCNIYTVNKMSFISKSSNTKLLGIIDKTLEQKYHCTQLTSNFISDNYQMKNITYASWVRLRYATGYSNVSTFANSVFIEQKCILRTVTDLDNQNSCIHVFINFHILTLPSLDIFDMIIDVNPPDCLRLKLYKNLQDRRKNITYMPI